MFIVTPKAIGILRTLLDPEGKSLRLTATSGGCSGIRYGMTLVDEVDPGEEVHVRDGLRFVLDGASARLLEGATIDFVDGADGAGFVFENPNAIGRCS